MWLANTIIILSLFSTVVFLFVSSTSYFHYAFSSTPCLNYNESRNLVTILCDMNFNALSNHLDDDGLIEEESPGVWLLHTSIKVSPKTSFVIDGIGVKWLKMIGGNNESISIVISGNAEFRNVKITSWDPETNSVINQNTPGNIPRPFILVDGEGQKLNIINSEIGYLGYNKFPSNGLVYSRGGSGSVLENSSFHDLWDGYFSNNVGFMNIKNNTYYNNLRYGIDIHSSSHDFSVSDNVVYNNTKAGINSSQDCYNILFDNNTLYQNGETGLMFSLNTQNSTMSNNFISNETVGISIFSSSRNDILNNKIESSIKNILISGNSTEVSLTNNSIG